jgi:hypothetical protein
MFKQAPSLDLVGRVLGSVAPVPGALAVTFGGE